MRDSKTLTERITAIKPGDRVSYKAAGTCARLEGMAGQIVTATVTDKIVIDGNVFLHVIADYRKVPGQKFEGMESSVPETNIRSVE